MKILFSLIYVFSILTGCSPIQKGEHLTYYEVYEARNDNSYTSLFNTIIKELNEHNLAGYESRFEDIIILNNISSNSYTLIFDNSNMKVEIRYSNVLHEDRKMQNSIIVVKKIISNHLPQSDWKHRQGTFLPKADLG